MKKIGYIRATSKSEIEQQSELLIACGCEKIFVEPKEHINSQSKKVLYRLIASIDAGDTLSITRLSILSSSVQSLLEMLYKLEDKKIVVEATEQQFSTSETHTLDELLFYLCEFVEDIRYERQAIGIQKAKQRGQLLGRPPKLTQAQVIHAIELKQNFSSQQVANRLGVGRSTLLRHIANNRKGA